MTRERTPHLVIVGGGFAGLWAARRVGDDVEVYGDEAQTKRIGRFHFLRDQRQRPKVTTCRSLADLVSTDKGDHLGAFAVTAGHGELEIAKRFKDAGDDYSAIMATTLADRLAEAYELINQAMKLAPRSARARTRVSTSPSRR